ncbi:hypothetical protein RUM43_014847 [Polyplax serrata]|uniref:Uncharacterized protein n=1 Tax=Polyplax serrata TaxID=468196 RepID=A0AAN8PGL1_POLSC
MWFWSFQKSRHHKESTTTSSPQQNGPIWHQQPEIHEMYRISEPNEENILTRETTGIVRQKKIHFALD